MLELCTNTSLSLLTISGTRVVTTHRRERQERINADGLVCLVPAL